MHFKENIQAYKHKNFNMQNSNNNNKLIFGLCGYCCTNFMIPYPESKNVGKP